MSPNDTIDPTEVTLHLTMAECSFEIGEQAVLQAAIRPATIDADAGVVFYRDVSNYQGPYEADALFSEQVFATRSKRMTDDFTVHAINYTEAPNDFGTTVTIGG